MYFSYLLCEYGEVSASVSIGYHAADLYCKYCQGPYMISGILAIRFDFYTVTPTKTRIQICIHLLTKSEISYNYSFISYRWE
jgi:hypothetical protein